MGAYALSVTECCKTNKQIKSAVATSLTLAMLCAVSKAYKYVKHNCFVYG